MHDPKKFFFSVLFSLESILMIAQFVANDRLTLAKYLAKLTGLRSPVSPTKSMLIPYISEQFVIYALVALAVIELVWIIRLEVRMSKFFSSSNVKNFEGFIVELKEKIEALKKFEEQAIEYFRSVEGRLKRSIQTIRTKRFNPFKGTGEGGNQSFTTAFISERGDGIVLTSMYSRDRVSVFSKPVEKFSSEFEMTNEEQDILKEAKEKLSSEKI